MRTPSIHQLLSALNPKQWDLKVPKRSALPQFKARAGDWWYDNHTVHSLETEEPFVHGDQFTVIFTMDLKKHSAQSTGV
jgi:hypothetical protein